MNDRFTKFVLTGLLAAILASQWLTELVQYRQSAAQIDLLRSIDAQLKKQAETTDELMASIDDLADVLDDVHGHVEGLGE